MVSSSRKTVFGCLNAGNVSGFYSCFLVGLFCCLFCCFMSKVNSYGQAGWSVHLITLFPGQAWTSSKPVLRAHTFACNRQQPVLNDSVEGKRMVVEVISWSNSTKVWDWARIKLGTPGSAVRHASVARHVTDCATHHRVSCWYSLPIHWHTDCSPSALYIHVSFQ